MKINPYIREPEEEGQIQRLVLEPLTLWHLKCCLGLERARLGQEIAVKVNELEDRQESFLFPVGNSPQLPFLSPVY